MVKLGSKIADTYAWYVLTYSHCSGTQYKVHGTHKFVRTRMRLEKFASRRFNMMPSSWVSYQGLKINNLVQHDLNILNYVSHKVVC